MPTKTPLVAIKCDCPVCGRAVQNRYVKAKKYSILKGHDDGRPEVYRWLDPDFAHIRPQDYFLWYCPHCRYVDTRGAFRDPSQRGRNFDMVQEALKQANRATDPVLQRLASRIDQAREPVEPRSAFMVHLLGIYVHQLPREYAWDAERLGRFYLRLAWYWEEVERARLPLEEADRRVLDGVAGDWEELPCDSVEAARRAVDRYRRALDQVRREPDRRTLKTLALIGHLNRAVTDFDAALDCAKQIFNQARERRNVFRRSLEYSVSRGSGGSAELEKLHVEIEWLNNMIEQTRTFRDDVVEDIIKVETPRLLELLRKEGVTLSEEMLSDLKSRGFHEFTLRSHLKQPYSAPEEGDEDQPGEEGKEEQGPRRPGQEKTTFWKTFKAALLGEDEGEERQEPDN